MEKLGLQRRYMLRKGKSAVKGDPKKSWSGVETEAEPSRRRLGWRLAWWGSTEKNEALHLLGSRGRHQYSDQRSNRIRAPSVAFTAVGIEGKEDQMARSSA